MKFKIQIVFIFFLPLIALAQVNTTYTLKVLGVVQDGGLPHLGSNKLCCDETQSKRHVTSLILINNKNNKFIEYSPLSLKYLKEISKTIKSNNGGLLLIDYGFSSQGFRDTLQAIEKHKFANILGNIGNRDITYNLNFNFLKKFIPVFISFLSK